jgi:tetratricopeptide (TPR) repeat protein
LINLSKKLIKLKEFQEALTHLRTASEVNADDPQIQYLVAFTLRRLKRYREAVDAYDRFLAQAKGSQRNSGIFGIAKALELQGNTERAVEFYQQFIEVERRPERRRWVAQARKSIQRLKASQVALIKDDQEPGEPEETAARSKLKSPASSPAKLNQISKGKEEPAPSTSGGEPALKEKSDDVKSDKDEKSESKAKPQESTSVTTDVSVKLNTALAQADRLFADRKYREATQVYQQIAQRNLPVKLRSQLRYFAAVSAYLSAQFDLAQREAELGLLDHPKSSRLRGLAVLSFVQKQDRREQSVENYQSAFSQVRLALREGRFHSCLELIELLVDQYNSSRVAQEKSGRSRSKYSPLSDPLLLHAKGRALLGLKRYQDAYLALSQAARGFKHPHLTLDLALTAQRMGDTKRARAHFQTLKSQTSPKNDRSSSLLNQVAHEGIQSVESSRGGAR